MPYMRMAEETLMHQHFQLTEIVTCTLADCNEVRMPLESLSNHLTTSGEI